MIDLHGMTDKNQYDIIVGYRALKKYKSSTEYKKVMINLLEVLEKFSMKYNLNIGYNVIFQGYISEQYYTISQQGNSIGITTVQLELSKAFRDSLVKNDKILSNFAKTILNFYKLNQK